MSIICTNPRCQWLSYSRGVVLSPIDNRSTCGVQSPESDKTFLLSRHVYDRFTSSAVIVEDDFYRIALLSVNPLLLTG